jgi:hypothetical protein
MAVCVKETDVVDSPAEFLATTVPVLQRRIVLTTFFIEFKWILTIADSQLEHPETSPRRHLLD